MRMSHGCSLMCSYVFVSYSYITLSIHVVFQSRSSLKANLRRTFHYSLWIFILARSYLSGNRGNNNFNPPWFPKKFNLIISQRNKKTVSVRSRFKYDTRLFQMQILRTDVFRYLKLRLCHDPAIVTFFGVIGWPNL